MASCRLNACHSGTPEAVGAAPAEPAHGDVSHPHGDLSKFGYKPTPAQLTIGYVAQHLAADNYFYCNSFGPLKGTPAAADTTTADSVKATWPRDSLLVKLRASFKFCEDALAQLDDTKLSEPIEVRQGNTVVNITRAQRGGDRRGAQT